MPVNDTSIQVDHSQRWAKLRDAEGVLAQAEHDQREAISAPESARKKADKAVAKALRARDKALTNLRKNIDKDLAAPKKLAASSIKAAAAVLPQGRTKQPRGFPSVTPDDPRVFFIWPDAEPPDDIRATLASIVGRLVRLGHSSSLICARLTDNPNQANWFPDDNGAATLRVVSNGQLERLRAAYEYHRGEKTRVLPHTSQRYRNRDSNPEPPAPSARSYFAEDWLIFRRVDGPRLSLTSTQALTATVRKVLQRYADQPVAEIISGHQPDGQPSLCPHVAIAALPFLGARHATGNVLGFAVIPPHKLNEQQELALYRAIGRWEEEHRQHDEDTPTLPIHLGRAGVMRVERVDEAVPAYNLQPSTWCRRSTVWASATPIALDRFPGDMSARDPERARKACENARSIIANACTNIGLPEPASVEVTLSGPLVGVPPARHFPPYPRGRQRPHRFSVHATIRFSAPVRGPILIGAGRFLGLGLMRPVRERA